MIELKNISKIYRTKSKRKVYALSDVSLRFPDRGLCVVMGQSGCGKTTLLNILGGLDSKFKGEYYFLNKKLRSDKDYTHFRRDYVGFVFQDFNLVEDLTVSENIDIGSKFTQNDAADLIEQALTRVGLPGYGDRYPSELSGGEQQRIAIARALLKDCRLLLADEPTGNLDRKMGREIYNLLKEISKEKLVIVVSHDEELGNEFADYTILLDKGMVVSHNLPDSVSTEQYVEKRRKAISNKIAFKMAKHEYLRKKGQSIASTALVTLCFLVLSFAVVVFQYNEADVHYRLITSQNYEYFYLDRVIGDDMKSYIDSGIDCIRADYDRLYFESKQDAENHGIKFYESDKTMELSASTYYLSDDAAQYRIDEGEIAYIDGKWVQLDPDKHSVVDLIGAILQGAAGVCGGVYYSYRDAAISADPVTQYHTDMLQGRICTPFLQFDSNGQSIRLEGAVAGGLDELRIESSIDTLDHETCLVLNADGNVDVFRNGEDVSFTNSLQPNEAYISLITYNKLFGTRLTGYDLLDIEVVSREDCISNVKMMPSGIGSEINVTIRNDKTNEELSLSDIKIKGIVFVVHISWYESENWGSVLYDTTFNERSNNVLYINDMDIISKCLHYGTSGYVSGWIRTSSVKDLKRFIHSAYTHEEEQSHGNYAISTPFNRYEFELTGIVNNIILTLILLSIPLLVSTILVLNLTISSQIKNRTRELGIFKVFGAQNKDFAKIYIFELLLIALPTMLFAILGSLALTLLLNALIVSNYYPQLQLLFYGWLNAPIAFTVGLLLILFAMFTPLLKLTKLDVIEAIKSS